MKRWLTYVLIGGLLVAISLMIYFYREYLGEDTDPMAENQVNPLINKRLNAIVTSKSTATAGHQPTIDVAYTDIDTQEASSFTVNDAYQQSIHVGDTLTKEKGEKLVLIYQKAGKIETVPID